MSRQFPDTRTYRGLNPPQSCQRRVSPGSDFSSINPARSSQPIIRNSRIFLSRFIFPFFLFIFAKADAKWAWRVCLLIQLINYLFLGKSASGIENLDRPGRGQLSNWRKRDDIDSVQEERSRDWIRSWHYCLCSATGTVTFLDGLKISHLCRANLIFNELWPSNKLKNAKYRIFAKNK